jgi:hypothetical protein
MTIHKAFAAPAQTGSKAMAMMSLIHFGMRGFYAQIETVAIEGKDLKPDANRIKLHHEN